MKEILQRQILIYFPFFFVPVVIQDNKEFISGRLPSFATIQETNLPAGGFKTQKQVYPQTVLLNYY
jgi:hypothetical protein